MFGADGVIEFTPVAEVQWVEFEDMPIFVAVGRQRSARRK
jgi:hypothetical protein